MWLPDDTPQSYYDGLGYRPTYVEQRPQKLLVEINRDVMLVLTGLRRCHVSDLGDLLLGPFDQSTADWAPKSS
jgi:hypothetical protein